MNNVKYKQFVRQAKGANVTEIHINRVDKRSVVQLQYNGRAPKGRNRVNGQWLIDREERPDEAVVEEIKTFLSMARKDFFVRRGEGLEGETYADAKMEEAVKPIVKDKE